MMEEKTMSVHDTVYIPKDNKKEKTIIIHDTVYTYIEIKSIEKSIVKNIIDTESFQRLKNIRQLTVQHLYPTANHTRFEHSLGVMHLALRVFERIKPALFPAGSESGTGGTHDDEISLKNHLLYAALLHDVGHAPLSHVGELFYDRADIIKETGDLLQKEEIHFSIDFLNDPKIAPHELMSCYVIIKKFKDGLKTCFSQTGAGPLDLEFIFRIICGRYYKPGDNNNNNKKRNVIISIVNSETFDVDKLDYLLRDNKMVGYIGPQIDIERLLMSVTVNKDEDRFTFTQMGISAIQRIIDCRDNLYLWVYNHHTVVYTDYLYQECFIHFDKLYHDPDASHEEKMSLRDLFSCRAVADDCVSDMEALSAINRAAKAVKDHKTSSDYTKKLINQLVGRKHLKSLWKTLNRYNQFLAECACATKEKKLNLTKFIEKKENRRKLVNEILSELNMEHGNGDLFIINRENKFYEYNLEYCEIKHYDAPANIKDLLPFKNYDEKYEKTAFYVFYDALKIDEAKLKDLLKDKLTKKSDIQPGLGF